MRKILFFKRLKEKVRASGVNLACVFMIALLTGACASEYKNQTSFEISPPPSPGEVSVTYPNETAQVSTKGELENGVTNDDQEIVCRSIKVTGSRIGRKKVCATKAEWAALDKKNKGKAERLIRDIEQASAMQRPSSDEMGGQSSAMPY